MKIKRDEDKKKPKTPEEEELSEYKRAKNIGLASLVTGTAIYGLSTINKNGKLENLKIDPRDRAIAKWGGLGLGVAGLGLHGISAAKYRILKNKLKKKEEEKADDNTKKEK